MNLTSPNDVKRPSTKNPNLDRIINEIEINFNNEDFTQHTDEFVEMKLLPNYANMDMITIHYINKGWKAVKYRVASALRNDHSVYIKFYY